MLSHSPVSEANGFLCMAPEDIRFVCFDNRANAAQCVFDNRAIAAQCVCVCDSRANAAQCGLCVRHYIASNKCAYVIVSPSF